MPQRSREQSAGQPPQRRHHVRPAHIFQYLEPIPNNQTDLLTTTRVAQYTASLATTSHSGQALSSQSTRTLESRSTLFSLLERKQQRLSASDQTSQSLCILGLPQQSSISLTLYSPPSPTFGLRPQPSSALSTEQEACQTAKTQTR